MLIHSRPPFSRLPSGHRSQQQIGRHTAAGTMARCEKSPPPIVLLFSVLVCSGCGSAPDLETSRLFQSAEQIFSDADSPAEFVEAATVYQEILDSGFLSGTVFYNQGNAWMRAGETGRAIAAYRQAQRHLPRDPYLDANLRTALAGSQLPTGGAMLDYIFFWQSAVSYNEKLILTTVLLAMALLLAMSYQLNRRRIALKRIAYATMIPLVLSAAAVGRDWQQYEQTVRGVVVAETTARKGDSETYDPAFLQSLSDGTEFEVINLRNDWIHARFRQTGTGWISSQDCVTY
ncbi:MAG: tetratricopeptide repeat protein [Fuerstiella sp.]|nr:tetratricopeptide repeat protein [Fuerstiella sp.]